MKFAADTPIVLEVSSFLTQFLNALRNLNSQEKRLREEIKRLELLHSDRLHQAELFQLDEQESVIFVQSLHESLLERRRRKNELAAILAEKDVLQKMGEGEVKAALNSIGALGKQEYRCRAISENDPIIARRKTELQ